MSDETKRPFEVGEWVTNGKVCGVVHYDETLPGFIVRSEYDWNPNDWSRWSAFDPASVAEHPCELAALEAERDEAEARVAELESERWQKAKAEWELEARIVELTPPEGHVAVHLPREDVEWLWEHTDESVTASGEGWYVLGRIAKACRKALGVTCSVCNDTVPSGHPCSCDDGRS